MKHKKTLQILDSQKSHMRPPLPRHTQQPSPAMASHSPLSTTVARKRSKTQSEEALNPSFADLPSSLLEVIMSQLVLKDNIRASAACKSWLEAGVSVRVVEKHPWLLCFSKHGSLIKLRDPLQWKSYTLDLPELAKSTVCYSRDGWLLMHRSSSSDIFFFNPFSRELISLPKLDLSFEEIAFSCSPTMDSCVVIALNFVVDNTATAVTASTCSPGATEWITEDFPTRIRGDLMQSKLVYLKNRFFCFNAARGVLCSFKPSSRKWRLHPFAYIDSDHQWNGYEKAGFLAEKNGELFLMFTSGNEKPRVYKFSTLVWQEMSITDLDGLTIFVSFHNSELRSNLPWMRNNVYFSRSGYNRKRCVSYSFDESRYDPCKEWQNWSELCPPQTLWIDPPNNVLDYL
ncbi:unnamed protein product [Thlaspi arvense]|uniref:KIB1-4 beta-propeller domain-containing protein n=1 Tax=Thlaspi arvense TaxID=13288 RepID=A0AAU9SR53_THLAR|nr:unnamed protein product [Thlaspi arvense]